MVSEQVNLGLGFSLALATSNMMAFIPECDNEMVEEVESVKILTNEIIKELLLKFDGRAIDKVIRCHFLNNKKLYQQIPSEISRICS